MFPKAQQRHFNICGMQPLQQHIQTVSPSFLFTTRANPYLLETLPFFFFYLKQHLKSSLTNSLL